MAIAEIDLQQASAEELLCPHCGEKGEAVCSRCGHALTADEIRQARGALRERVRSRIRSGEALTVVADTEGLAHQTVSHWTMDVERLPTVVGKDGRARPSRKADAHVVAQRRAEVERLTAEGLTAQEIAEKLDVPLAAVTNDRKALKQGVEERRAAVRRLTEAGLSRPEIARQLAVAERTVGHDRPWLGISRSIPAPAARPADSGQGMVNDITMALRQLASTTEFLGAVPVPNPEAAERLAREWLSLIVALKFRMVDAPD